MQKKTVLHYQQLIGKCYLWKEARRWTDLSSISPRILSRAPAGKRFLFQVRYHCHGCAQPRGFWL